MNNKLKYIYRLNLLTQRDPIMNKGIINKLKRKLRKMGVEV